MDIRQEDGTLKWLRTSTQRETVSISSTLQQSVGMVDDAYNAVADIVAERRKHPFRRNKETGSGCYQG